MILMTAVNKKEWGAGTERVHGRYQDQPCKAGKAALESSKQVGMWEPGKEGGQTHSYQERRGMEEAEASDPSL